MHKVEKLQTTYSLQEVENNARSIITYVKECMKEKKLGTLEIRQYEKQATMHDHDHLITVSQEYLDMLNNMDKQECKVTYLW